MADRTNQQKLDDLWWRFCTPEGLAVIAEPIGASAAAETWGFTNPSLDPRDMRQIVADIPKDTLAPLPGAVWSYTNPNIPGGDTYEFLRNIPANVLNQKFTLPDGTVTNLAGILSAIHAQPATITGGVLDVDGLVARLKAELPAAVLAELTTKLSQ